MVRVLGGADYWRYGVDELAALARRRGQKLALLPGDRRADARLAEASTFAPDRVDEIWRYFDEGGPANMASCLASFAYADSAVRADVPLRTQEPVAACGGRFQGACYERRASAPQALIVFYRSIYLAGDLAPIEALARALHVRGFATTSVYVTSLKDEAALAPLTRLARQVGASSSCSTPPPFWRASTRAEPGTDLSIRSTRPLLQVVLAGLGIDAWRASPRGLGPADLAMHVALPEIDGRILTRAISFKTAAARDDSTEFAAVAHRPLDDRVAFVADLASCRGRALRERPSAGKRLALVLPDYPGARRAHRLCGRPRHAGERHGHRRDFARRRLCDIARPPRLAVLDRGTSSEAPVRGRRSPSPAMRPNSPRPPPRLPGRSFRAPWGAPADDP